MRRLFFDTETTGLKPGNICQLAYILCDGGEAVGRNYYYRVGYMEPGAQRIHGYGVETLERLSGGAVFADSAERVGGDFASCQLWVAHNLGFDLSFLSAEFRKCGCSLAVNDQFCTMRHYAPIMKLPPKWPKHGANGAAFYKYPNLGELIDFIGLTKDEIVDFACKAFETERAVLNNHDARYDCAAACLCYTRGREAGYGPD